MINYIDHLPISEKRVFIRADLNTPLTDLGEVADDTRIQAILPTLRYALGQKCKIILASHLGRPKGERVNKLSLKPVGEKLAELLGDVDVLMPEDCIGDGVKSLSTSLKSGQIMLLENLRFHAEEEENNRDFARKLASLAEVYINDAFGTCHRAHASTAGITEFFDQKGGGFLLRNEIGYLSKVTETPERPLVAIIGGAKVSDKLGVLENLINLVDSLLIGGGMAYTFLAAQGIEVGKSLIEPGKAHTARRILERAENRGKKILLPIDHIVADNATESTAPETTIGQEIPKEKLGLDVGPKTIEEFASEIKKAKTVFWNGPLGMFELHAFANGTLSIAKELAKSSAITIVGGGDSLRAIKQSGVSKEINHLSTGGGASLEFIEGKNFQG